MGVDWYISFTQEPSEEIQRKIKVYEDTVQAGLPVHPELQEWIKKLEYVTEGDVEYSAPEEALGHIKISYNYGKDNALISLEELRKRGVTHLYLDVSY